MEETPMTTNEQKALAKPPYFQNSGGVVRDATGSRVIVCSWEGDCPLLFREIEVEKYGHFICPKCGRLGQRMVEATPEQCGL
jgi:predicted RNA-binding Zn-ribbon protein involved in translation (DUF1610 family)